MKRWSISVLVLLILAAGTFWWFKARSASADQYTLAPVERGDLQSTVTSTGTLEAVTAVDVGSEVSGVIETLYVEHNSLVKKGQLLAQINPETVQAEMDKAQASFQRARSSLANSQAQEAGAQAGIRSAQAQVLSAQARLEKTRAQEANSRASLLGSEANLRKAQADLDNARRSYERIQALRDQDLVSQDERDQAHTQALSAQASLDAARASLEGARAVHRSATLDIQGAQADLEAARVSVQAAREQLTSAQAQVAGARADVGQAQANLEAARVNLGKTSIRSPIDGIVLDVLVSEGQTVAAQFQAPNLFILARNLEAMQVLTTVDEADIGLIQPGSQATFTVDAWPETTFEGKVAEVRQSAVTTNNVVTYPVVVHTSNPGLRLKPGMTATVSIAIECRENVLMVPNSALRFRPADDANVAGGPSPAAKVPSPRPGASPSHKGPRKVTVYTLDPTDPSRLLPHRVVPGITDGVNTELVESDLQTGQQVLTGTTRPPASNSTRRRPPRPI
ncbi:MAG: efflux RND transporter periplasmic adaptor subunit [Burkholderiales bacterium]|nr:efflux RND transporter periplasmic adaptor subunit [Burkholderiales bacterium]